MKQQKTCLPYGAPQRAAITVERLEQSLVLVAWLVENYGPRYVPLYESIENWLAEVHAGESTRARIKRLLADNRNMLPARAA